MDSCSSSEVRSSATYRESEDEGAARSRAQPRDTKPNSLFLLSLFLALTTAQAYAQSPAVAYVAAQATDPGKHGDAGAVFTSLRQALAAGAREIHVAPGIYDEGSLAVTGGGTVTLRRWDVGAGNVTIRGILTLNDATTLVLEADGAAFRILGDLFLSNGTLRLQGSALELNAPAGTTGTLFVGAGGAMHSAGQCEDTPVRYTGAGTIHVFLQTTADTLRRELPCIEVAMEQTGVVTFNASGLPATTAPPNAPDRLDVLGTPRFTIFSAADTGGVRLLDGLDVLDIEEQYLQFDGGLLMAGRASTGPGAVQPTVQTLHTGDAFIQEAGTFYASGGAVAGGGDFLLGPNAAQDPGNALFSIAPEGIHTVQGAFRVAPDVNAHERRDGDFDAAMRNRYFLGNGRLVVYGDYRFEGTGDHFDDDAFLEQDQGLDGLVTFAGTTPQRVFHRQDEDAFFEDVTLDGDGGLRLQNHAWQNYSGRLTLRQGRIVPEQEFLSWVIVNTGFEADLGDRNNAAEDRGVVVLGSDESFAQGEVIRIIERGTLGVLSTGGYLFPVGAACVAPVNCASSAIFRPLILEFPADLGATSTARVKYRPDLRPEDLAFPASGLLVDDFHGGTLKLDVLGRQFWQLEFDQIPALHPNLRVEAAGLPNVNDIESLRLMQWDCDGTKPRLAVAQERPSPNESFVFNTFIQGVPNLKQEDVDVQACQIIGIASNAQINPIDVETGEPGFTNVQFINGAINTDTVDVYIDDVRLLNDFHYLTATPFEAMPSGTHKIDLVAHDDADNAAPLWTGEPLFLADVNYAMIAVDGASGPDVLVQDGVRLEAESGDIEFTVVHAVPDAQELDIRLANPIDPDRPELLVNNIAPGEISTYRRLPPAGYSFQITSADNSAVYNKNIRLEFQGLQGKTMIMLIEGHLADAPLPLWLFGFETDGNLIAAVVVRTEDDAAVPEAFALRGNYPNPFNPSTTLTFDLPEAADVHAVVFDVLGRAVMTTPAQRFETGAGRTLALDATALASGTYLYRVVARTATRTLIRTGRMVLAR